MSERSIGNDVAYVAKQAQDHDVRFLRLWFTDILGFLKSISIPTDTIEDVMIDGVSFDGSSIKGLARTDERDLVAKPDGSTFAVLPWRPSRNRVARVFADVRTPDGEPHLGDPRNVLRTQVQRAGAMGYTFYASAELEFFLLRDEPSGVVPADSAGYFDQDVAGASTEVRRDVVLQLEQMGIAVSSSHHEGAPGQQEICLQYSNGLHMADAIQTARFVVKEIAQKHGLFATFMPRPFSEHNGSGMHMGLSLVKEGENAFFDGDDSIHLSNVARSFVAGVLNRAKEFTAVTNQWVNSFRRLVPGTEAPMYISWAQTNRSDLVRVPAHKPGKEQSTRVEIRLPDAACNPYLTLAVLLAAGLDGIEGAEAPPNPVTRNVFMMTREERAEAGVESLPSDLGQAIALAEDSDFLSGVLGATALNLFLENKTLEWEAYRAHVSDWERARHLRSL